MTLFVFYSVLHSVLWASSYAAGYVEVSKLFVVSLESLLFCMLLAFGRHVVRVEAAAAAGLPIDSLTPILTNLFPVLGCLYS